MADFLFEIGTEELPPKSLRKLSEALAEGIVNGLQEAGIDYKNKQIFASPRRLALLLSEVAEAQPDSTLEKSGPKLQAAKDKAGHWTKAAFGFARACGCDIDTIQEKNGRLFYQGDVKGKKTADLLPAIIQKAIKQLPIGKPMRWGSSTVGFIRPVHWIVACFGQMILKETILGLTPGRVTYGHRFHAPVAITLDNLNDYEKRLEKARVIASFDKRKTMIKNQINQLKVAGLVLMDEGLLEEVTSIVEWPNAQLGSFSQDFSNIPAEALISSMQVHQRCFPVMDKQQKLLPYFVLVANIASEKPEIITHGNEAVMRARLNDAKFFFEHDLKLPLDEKLPQLEKVIFQAKLGTLADKTNRLQLGIIALIDTIAHGADKKLSTRAAQLAKCDLLTDMVGEFPELQGIMGGYYSAKHGENPIVSDAIKEHYLPQSKEDSLPQTDVGALLSITDRLDTLVGIIGIGQGPTGEKDPFGCRRAALGIIRTMIDKKWYCHLPQLTQAIINHYPTHLLAKDTEKNVLKFIQDRLKIYLISQYHFTNPVVSAVLSRPFTDIYDSVCRVQAIKTFKENPACPMLAMANKRIGNILKKSPMTDDNINDTLLKDNAEIILAQALSDKLAKTTPLLKNRQYQQSLVLLAELRDDIDNFFDNVMVMTDDKALQQNRLRLLKKMQHLFLQVADISQLQAMTYKE